MFVFQEADLDNILDVVITNMTPSRSPSQKPIPANLLFLAARYAHWHANPELMEALLSKAFARINNVVDDRQWDMTIMAFWLSNSLLLLHYLRKDAGLVDATQKYQLVLADVIQEIFILILRDAERRIDKVLDKAVLDHEPIPGFEDITFQHEWKIFKSKSKPKPPEPLEKRFRPPSPKRQMQPSPRNVTSLLSSTLFVLELYDIHSVILVQILAQLFYWLGAEIFNRILNNRKYLARTKAMQIRMNISTLEDWALQNNRAPEHYEAGSTVSSGETSVEAAKKHLGPVQQLLQWLQVLSSIGEDFEALIGTLQSFPRLNPAQLIHAVKFYRPEVGESTLPKGSLKYLETLSAELQVRHAQEKAKRASASQPITGNNGAAEAPSTPVKGGGSRDEKVTVSPQQQQQQQGINTSPWSAGAEQDDAPDNLFMDASLTLPFMLPSVTDMLVSYGAGFGGKNRDRERKYIPSVPPDFLNRLDFGSSVGSRRDVYEGHSWEGDE